MNLRLDPIALYGAGLSSLIFVWQIYTWWRTGPRLRVRTARDMQMFGAGGMQDDRSYVVINVVINVANVGNGDTTITHVALYGYKGWWAWLRKKETKVGIVNHAVAAYPLPYVLKAGQTFMSMVHQDATLCQWSREMRLYGVIIHSSSKRAVLARIDPISNEKVGKEAAAKTSR